MNDEVVGYLTGYMFSEFKCIHKGIYSPEWAHGTTKENSKEIYDAMYNNIATRWLDEQCIVHAITLFTYNDELMNQLFWKGYGMHVVDAIGEAKLVDNTGLNEIKIRAANKNDVEQLVELLG